MRPPARWPVSSKFRRDWAGGKYCKSVLRSFWTHVYLFCQAWAPEQAGNSYVPTQCPFSLKSNQQSSITMLFIRLRLGKITYETFLYAQPSGSCQGTLLMPAPAFGCRLSAQRGTSPAPPASSTTRGAASCLTVERVACVWDQAASPCPSLRVCSNVVAKRPSRSYRGPCALWSPPFATRT